MSETNYFWQGGRKIEVQKDDSTITIHATSEADARTAVERAGVEIGAIEPVTTGLVRATIIDDRERSVNRLRAENNVVHHVYCDQQTNENEYLITESFFIKFKQDTPENRILEYLEAENLVVEQAMGDKTYLVQVTNATGRNPIRTANAAASREDVEYAEPNLIRPLMKFAFIPPDSLFSQQWHLHAPDPGTDLVAGAGIFAPEAWDLTRGQREIVIAVADDGFDLTHPDFQGQSKVVAQMNANPRGGNNAAIDWDENVMPRPGDYHGTPCLGVAVAEGNGTGVVGVAPGCSLVAIRFPLEVMTDAHFIIMFEKISALVDIVSCSWGAIPGNFPMSTALKTTMTTLAKSGGRRGKGLVFCIAAGNNNCPVQDLNNTRTYHFRGRFRNRSYSGPVDRWIAAHPDVITVSASTSRKTRAAYSSWGKQISVCAPSDNWDDLGQSDPPGRGIVTTDNEGFGLNSDFTAGSRFTGEFGGTSSATPTVAGVCGLVLSANSGLTALGVRKLLQDTADKDMSLETDTPVNESGDFNSDGFSLWFGFGKVNAFRAVQAATSLDEERRIDIQQNNPVDIPDASTPILSPIEINEDGRILEFRVQVNITHTFIGDLRVDLITPDGTAVVLHNQTGGSANNLVRTYSLQDIPSLRPLLDKSIRGIWQLQVRDTFLLDVGRLNGWRIVARVSG